MGLKTPYRRTARPFSGNTYTDSGKWKYVLHKNYSDSPENFIRAFLLLQRDILDLFNYVEPSDTNLSTFSHRIHELFLRCCVEFEANCKAVLRENGYNKPSNWNIRDYVKIEQSHYLTQFEVKIPNWDGNERTRTPFKDLSNNQSPAWYRAYNSTKHDRHLNFYQANFKNLTDSFCGLSVILAAQFIDHDFSPAGDTLVISHTPNRDNFFGGIGDYLLIKYPQNIPEDQRYDFDLSNEDFKSDIFNCYPYK